MASPSDPGYRTPAGKAALDEGGHEIAVTDSSLVGSGSTRWSIRFIRKRKDGAYVFEVVTYQVTRKWWGGAGPLRETARCFVRGDWVYGWRRDDGYRVAEATDGMKLERHLDAAARRCEWLEDEDGDGEP